ncbi:hypothetical protein IP92_00134 [Pseudoduganella flava]|uniref:Uncharacterized protein n=1 Tax=Pseudoduganella flava TaxID=871742 RepID=A0A562Q356_9BURK|nr:hypothetical protein [Pseudoduganella flava]QGZ41217.1 hypothetical protein GO485_20580 [Pseudoduganella flava]TWI51151.1 hypothetical protein IP92_00134 [Pseudoduganella flava]
MNLPDLALQIAYGRVAWALVAAALLLALLPQPSRRTIAGIGLASLVLMALPGPASPAYWLVLAFQFPSGVALGCALLALADRWRGRAVAPLLPPAFALAIVAAGTLLYLDAFGVVALGLYYAGFGGTGAPLLSCAAIVACGAAVIYGWGRHGAAALVAGLLLYALPRLPTGNLWDALLDPLLWTWALISAGAAAVRYVAAWRARAVPAAVQAEPASVPVAAIEQLQTARE